MKRLFVLFFVLLLAAAFVHAGIDASFVCDNNNCVEGASMNWSVSIFNNINKSIVVGQIYIVDVNTNQLIALHNSEEVLLAPQESHVFSFSNLVSAPISGYTFSFRPCFNASLGDVSSVVCKSSAKTLTVVPLSKIECFSSSDCDSNEFCLSDTKKCKPLSCKDGEVIADHKCVLPVCAWYQSAVSDGCVFNPLLVISVLLIVVGVVLFVIASKIRVKKVKNKKGSKKRN